MKTARWFHRSSAALVSVVLWLVPASGFGAVTADPTRVTFTSPTQSATINLTNNGVPIPAKDIGGWKLLASGHDYKHMLIVAKMDGALKVVPSKTLEVGSYDLSIDTGQGSVTVLVFAPLSDVPDIVEKIAAITGQSENKIKQTLGLSTIIGREKIQLTLPPVYYEGQTLELSMTAGPGRSHAWFINGDPVAEEPGRNAITYTFKDTGDYVLAYIESETVNGKVAPVGHAKAYTRVVPIPAVPTEVTVNTEIEFAPPQGYQQHIWRIDGQEYSTGASLKHTFTAPGVYTVECLAGVPNEGPPKGFQRIRYNTTVKTK